MITARFDFLAVSSQRVQVPAESADTHFGPARRFRLRPRPAARGRTDTTKGPTMKNTEANTVDLARLAECYLVSSLRMPEDRTKRELDLDDEEAAAIYEDIASLNLDDLRALLSLTHDLALQYALMCRAALGEEAVSKMTFDRAARGWVTHTTRTGSVRPFSAPRLTSATESPPDVWGPMSDEPPF